MKKGSSFFRLQWRFVGLVWMLAGLYFVASGTYRLSSGFSSRKWPHASGQIIKADVFPDLSSGNPPFYKLRVRYMYFVDQEEHQGHRITYQGGIGAEDQEYSSRQLPQAQSIIAKYPLGKEVNVYYNPDNNNDAVLEPGLNSQSWVGVLVGLPVVGLGMLFLTRTEQVREFRHKILCRANHRANSLVED